MKSSRKILSVSGVITNSSTETFVIMDKRSKEFICKLLENRHKLNKFDGYYDDIPQDQVGKVDVYSGEGGTIYVSDWRDDYKYFLSKLPEDQRKKYTPEIWAISNNLDLAKEQEMLTITIDEGFKGTISWLIKNFFTVESWNSTYRRDPITGKLTEAIDIDTWKSLPKKERS